MVLICGIANGCTNMPCYFREHGASRPHVEEVSPRAGQMRVTVECAAPECAGVGTLTTLLAICDEDVVWIQQTNEHVRLPVVVEFRDVAPWSYCVQAMFHERDTERVTAARAPGQYTLVRSGATSEVTVRLDAGSL